MEGVHVKVARKAVSYAFFRTGRLSPQDCPHGAAVCFPPCLCLSAGCRALACSPDDRPVFVSRKFRRRCIARYAVHPVVLCAARNIRAGLPNRLAARRPAKGAVASVCTHRFFALSTRTSSLSTPAATVRSVRLSVVDSVADQPLRKDTRDVPLLEAVSHGSRSIEVAIHLVDGQILVRLSANQVNNI